MRREEKRRNSKFREKVRSEKKKDRLGLKI
jgi:hypothetical protein